MCIFDCPLAEGCAYFIETMRVLYPVKSSMRAFVFVSRAENRRFVRGTAIHVPGSALGLGTVNLEVTLGVLGAKAKAILLATAVLFVHASRSRLPIDPLVALVALLAVAAASRPLLDDSKGNEPANHDCTGDCADDDASTAAITDDRRLESSWGL